MLDSPFFNGFTDYHSHILFGVDDGVEELSESLDILAFYESLGVKKVIMTPHISLMYNNWDLVESNFDTLKKSYTGRIELELAAEYLLDSGFITERKRGLRCVENKNVLVESSYLDKSANFDEVLYEITCEGYIPVIAHPERYLFMNIPQYHKLKNCDYLFQLNILSLSGHYGSQVTKRALYLLENDMYDFVGTDLHNLEVFNNRARNFKISSKQLDVLMKISQRI